MLAASEGWSEGVSEEDGTDDGELEVHGNEVNDGLVDGETEDDGSSMLTANEGWLEGLAEDDGSMLDARCRRRLV